MLYKSIINAVAVAVAVMFVGCGGGGNPGNGGGGGGGGGGDNYTYTGGTVTIGGKVWMAENLNRATANSKCYDNDASNCAKYGRLYNWSDAKSACPAGWHLPSDAEWTALTDAVGGASTAGTKLKATSGWYNDGNGTDQYGFSALPGGYGNSGGSFVDAGNFGNWWSATENNANSAWFRFMDYYNENVIRNNYYKSYLYSVRCVQN
jgi:uncharacterized protein (TIGR02145 family)